MQCFTNGTSFNFIFITKYCQISRWYSIFFIKKLPSYFFLDSDDFPNQLTHSAEKFSSTSQPEWYLFIYFVVQRKEKKKKKNTSSSWKSGIGSVLLVQFLDFFPEEVRPFGPSFQPSEFSSRTLNGFCPFLSRAFSACPRLTNHS